MLPWRHDEAGDLVIDGQMSEFMDTLACHGDQQLKVVAVIGSGGLGKTTFARVLFNKIRGQFDCRAFVAMTRKPSIKKVLCDILTQVQRQQPHDECKNLDITGRIRKHLQDKRYLIVVDDLWAASAWNVISRAFPEGSQRSRIIITTPVENVALTCCCYQSELVCEMKPLDVYHSRKLFFNRIFGSVSDCPETFKEVSYRIVGRCGGSPLSTINMASLLASHPVLSMEQWEYISDSLSTKLKISSASEGMKLVLNLSYNNLTHYLKTCLLYLNIYPDGCIICKDDLVKQWVAEGFIEATEGRDVESVARSYFDELIDRRFIQPACIKYNNEIVSCTAHDIVRDLIAHNSAEENFVMVVDSNRKNIELSDKVRRLFLNFGDEMFAKKPRNIGPSHVRSLAFSGVFACMPAITEFKLLRVLNLQFSGHRCDEILELTGISELFQLKYLKVVSDVCIKLPKHMRGLQYLETLDIDTKVTSVPWDIIHLPCLLHLHLPFETILMDWFRGIGSDIVQRLDKLTNLLDLRLTCSTPPPAHLQENMKALGYLLAGLGNLKSLAVVPGSPHENTIVRNPSKIIVSWDGFAPPLHIKKFEWSLCNCTFSRVPKWVGQFRNLYILKIVLKELLRDGVDILKRLPALTSLSLYVYSAPIERIVFQKAGFSVLKFFKFRCSVPWLKFEADAMPNLLQLKLGFDANRVAQHGKAYIVIEHLSCLKQICAKIGGVSDDAEAALMAAVVNHPRNPRINIRLVDCTFYGEEGSSTATREKEHGGMETQDEIQDETEDEVSREVAKKQADARIFTSSMYPSQVASKKMYPSQLPVSEGSEEAKVSQEDLFDVSGPTWLTNVDWKSRLHRQSVMASLVQGVYVLERDRQRNRRGPDARAPAWWRFFHFELLRPLVDDADNSIFGALYAFRLDRTDVAGLPYYVLAFGATITMDSWEHDLQLVRNGLLQTTSRFDTGMQVICELAYERVWLAGHSLGSAISALGAKALAREIGVVLPTYLFNAPFVSVVGYITSDRRFSPRWDRPSAALARWVPNVFVNPADPISADYVGYFKPRWYKVLHWIMGILKRNDGYKPLSPSAVLTVNHGPSPDFKAAHGIHQWWRPDLKLECTEHHYSSSS